MFTATVSNDQVATEAAMTYTELQKGIKCTLSKISDLSEETYFPLMSYYSLIRGSPGLGGITSVDFMLA
jgi:hypothetical protein